MAKPSPAHQGQKQARKHPLPEAFKASMFQKGKSGNPSGRKVGTGLSDALFALMEAPDPDYPGLTGAQALAFATLKLAKKGHPVALKECWDRIAGKVKLEVDIHSESQLWQRLNEGRLRLAGKVTTETTSTNAAGETVTTSETREISYDAPAPELDPIIEAIASHVEGSEQNPT